MNKLYTVRLMSIINWT